jgi:hypothetical protein
MDTIAPPRSPSALPAKSAGAAKDSQPRGLTGDEARRRPAKFGPNAMPDPGVRPFRMALTPVPALLVAGTLAAAAAFAFVLDAVKVPVFARLGIN